MSRRNQDDTKTVDFELEGIEEVTTPAPQHKVSVSAKGQPWKPVELPPLEVERPPELQEPVEPEARIWILERRARGLFAALRRWLVGKRK